MLIAIVRRFDYHIIMESKITSTVVARRLSDLLNRVRYRGERFVIVRGGEAIADLTPHLRPQKVRFADLVEAIRHTTPVDDALVEDLEAIQADQPALPEEPWASS